MNSKKVAIVLSGCGHLDGSEITETVSTLIAVSESETDYQLFAPSTLSPTVNHLNGSTEAPRQVLSEAARLGRGQIHDLKSLFAKNFDALIFPGGYGAAKVLCDFAQSGHQCSVLPEVERVIQDFYSAGKPIAAICIAPALVARVLGSNGITVTIGNDRETAAEIEKTGAHHEACSVTDFITDREHHLVTTPAYMYSEAKPHEVFRGIRSAIQELIEMA